MNRSRQKSRMKLISGGKQLSLIRDSEEVLKFLDFTLRNQCSDLEIVEKRLRACRLCFSLISDEEDSAAWIAKNISSVLLRQSEYTGPELDSLENLVKESLDDFCSWSADPFGWERRREFPSQEIFKKPEPLKPDNARLLTFPIRSNTCIEIRIPEGGLSVEEFQRLGSFLYPYCKDIDLTKIKTKSWGDECPDTQPPHTCT